MSIPRIVADLHTLGGAPRLEGTRMTPQVVAGYYREAGWQGTFEAYPHLTNAHILAACWYMVVNGGKKWRRHWGVWLDQNYDRLCDMDDTVELPTPW